MFALISCRAHLAPSSVHSRLGRTAINATLINGTNEAGTRQLCVQCVGRIQRRHRVPFSQGRIGEGRRHEVVRPRRAPARLARCGSIRWHRCRSRVCRGRGGLLDDRTSSTDRCRRQGGGPARSPDGAPEVWPPFNSVQGRQPSLFRGSRRQIGQTDHIAGGENMGHGCPGPPIDGQTPAIICLQACCRKIQASGGFLVPGTEQYQSPDQSLPRVQEQYDAPRRSCGNFQPRQRAVGLTACQPFLRPLNHDAQFVLSLLQHHL